LPLLLRADHRLERAAGRQNALRVVIPDDLVDLPEVEIVGPEPLQALLELLHRVLGPAVVRTVLRHQECPLPVALLGERLAHATLGLPTAVLPGVVQKGDTAVDRLVDDPDRFILLGTGEVGTADSEDGDVDTCPAERSNGNGHDPDSSSTRNVALVHYRTPSML